MWAQPRRGGGQSQHQLNVADGGRGAEHLTYSLVTSPWMPGSLQSLPSFTGHTQPLSLSLTSSMWATFKFQGGGRSGESKGWGRREKRRSNWTNEWAASLDLDQRGDSWQLERGIDVTFFSNKNCIIAEWAGAGEWRGAVGNLDRVCGARKNFADVLIKNLTTK